MTTVPSIHNSTSHPIGVFDSGIGGLTVVRALMESLPFERIVYFGDTARVPYGVKSAETITGYARQIVRFLLEKNVKLLIVACNTMSAVAYEAIVQIATVPVLDVIEAGAEMAAAATTSGRIGVIGTPATVESGAYTRAIQSRAPATTVFSQACPLFVPLVEEGWLDHPATRLIVGEYLAPVLARQIDTLVLGCTHYPLLKTLIQETAGKDVALIDSATAVARRAARLLEETGLATSLAAPPEHHFFVTDAPHRFRQTGESFLGRPIAPLEIVHWQP